MASKSPGYGLFAESLGFSTANSVARDVKAHCVPEGTA